MPKTTPLYETHIKHAGKLVEFAGYMLPVRYESGVIAEHMAVRNSAGLFDVSHMGEVLYTGPDALANINYLLCNDFSDMEDGKVRYSPMTNENGGIVDDLIVYRLACDRYMVVINAGNRDKDIAHMQKYLFGDVKFQDISDSLAQIAIQGPRAFDIVRRAVKDESLLPQKYYTSVEKSRIFGRECIISKTGYTGEDGAEIYCRPEDAAFIWESLLKEGEPENLIPCGLGARDTLRLEAAMPLYGHEMNDDITPFQTGLGMFVKLDKPGDFVGKKALSEKTSPAETRIGLRLTGKGIARENCDVYAGEQKIGITTSGTLCPFVDAAIAMAIADKKFSEIGTELFVDVRGKKIPAQVVRLPFYKKPSAKKPVSDTK